MIKQVYVDLLRTSNGDSLFYYQKDGKEFLKSQQGIEFSICQGIVCLLGEKILSGQNRTYQSMYDRIARFYDLAGKIYATFKEGSEKKRLMEYLSLLEIKNGDRVVEISIGTGRNIKYLNPGADYFGIDISSGMLKQCRRKMKRIGREIILIQAEAEFLPFIDDSFNVVFSAGGFNFFNDPGKAVTEMLRIAKPGTKILITDETEEFRLKHTRNEFYKNIRIRNPVEFLPDNCSDIQYKEICGGDLYVLTFKKPLNHEQN